MNVWVRVADPHLQRDVALATRRAGHGAWEADADALPRDRDAHFDVAVVDLSDATGWQMLRTLRSQVPRLRLLAIGPARERGSVIRALREGAHGFLRRPFDVESLERALESVASRARRRRTDAGLVAESPAMRPLLAHLERAARSDATVLLTGETGTGKSHLARWLHERSPRAGNPCVELDAGDLRGEGDFVTAAAGQQAAPLELADGGTLVLEGIERLSPHGQEAVLRLLQHRSVLHTHPAVDVRVVATSRCDLDRAVAEGRFSRDLRERLRVIDLLIPPLRERREDLLPLARRFLASFAPSATLPQAPLPSDLQRELAQHAFPGNLHELENWMRRTALDMPAAGPEPAATATTAHRIDVEGFDLREIECTVIARALEVAEGNRAMAARALGISPRTLRNKIRRYALD
ncbi:MAG: sigma 54-interacting transcriptional regulator [Myxococcota bacterium]